MPRGHRPSRFDVNAPGSKEFLEGLRGGGKPGSGNYRTQKQRRATAREELIDRMGGACMDCGTSDRRVLAVHHVNGNGKAERKRGVWGRYYLLMLERFLVDPSGYELLCYNCHHIKHLYQGSK